MVDLGAKSYDGMNISNNPASNPKNKVLLNRLRVLGDDAIVMMAIIG
jgi:hypothetical protein